jgi:hypothetical protein
MTTDRPGRRKPAESARRLVGGASVAGFLALVAALAATAEPSATEPSTAAAPAPVTLRVVISDPAIDRDAAIAAALDAAARGVDHLAVPIAGSAAQRAEGVPNVSHSTTRAS